MRVEKEWLADRSRIFRERDALVTVSRLLPAGSAPEILWSDDENYLYAMEAFSAEAESWKERLFGGDLNRATARRVGEGLGETIRASWGNEELRERFGDRTAFEQLRGDAYYGEISRRHPSIAQAVADWRGGDEDRSRALVHGDWSPKNMMVDGDRVVYDSFGILRYLEDVDPDQSMWEGECYVFDRRVSVGHGLVPGNHQYRNPPSRRYARHFHRSLLYQSLQLPLLPQRYRNG